MSTVNNVTLIFEVNLSLCTQFTAKKLCGICKTFTQQWYYS